MHWQGANTSTPSSLSLDALCSTQHHTAATLLSLLRAPRSQRHHLQHPGHRPRHLERPPGHLCEANLPAFLSGDSAGDFTQLRACKASSSQQQLCSPQQRDHGDIYSHNAEERSSTPVLSVLTTTTTTTQESITSPRPHNNNFLPINEATITSTPTTRKKVSTRGLVS
jgi:hypothetical protein